MNSKNTQKMSAIFMLMILFIQSVMTPILAIADTEVQTQSVQNDVLLKKFKVEKDEEDQITIVLDTEVKNTTGTEQTWELTSSLAVQLTPSTLPAGVSAKVDGKKIEIKAQTNTVTQVPLKLNVAKTSEKQQLTITDKGTQQKTVEIPQLVIQSSATETTEETEASSEADPEPEPESSTTETTTIVAEESATIESSTSETSSSTESSSEESSEVSSEEVVQETSDSGEEKPKAKKSAKIGVQAEGRELDASEVKITDFKLTDRNGNESTPSNPIDPFSSDGVKIQMNWELPVSEDGTHHVKKGDYYTFDLPKNLLIIENTLTGELKGSNGISFGTYEVSPEGRVTFTFNENVGEDSVHGDFELFSWIDTKTITREVIEKIEVPFVDGEKEFNLYLKPSGGGAINKTGKMAPFTGSEIQWQVDVNTDLKQLVNPVITDDIQDKLTLDPDSIEVYVLDVDINGNVKEGAKLDPSNYDLDTSDGNLQVKLKDLTEEGQFKAYRIKYKTTVNDAENLEDNQTFENTATFTNNGDTKSDSAKTQSNYGKEIDKKDNPTYNPAEQTFEWQIDYNSGQKKLAPGTHFTDTWNKSMNLESFDIYPATPDANGVLIQDGTTPIPTTEYEKTDDENGFTLNFPNGVDKQAYIIKYKTKLNGLITNPQDEAVENTVTIDGETKSGSKGTFSQFGVVKRNTNVNFDNRTMDWQIVINGNNYDMTNLKLTDTFKADGLSLHKETDYKLTLTEQDTGKKLVLGEDYKLTVTDSVPGTPGGFEIEFLGDYKQTNKTFVLDYTTDFIRNSDGTNAYPNHTSIDWEEGSEKRHTETKNIDIEPKKHFMGPNGAKSGSFNRETGRTTWNVDANYARLEIDPTKEFKIVDALQDNQEYVTDTLIAYSYKVEADGTIVRDTSTPLVKDVDYTFSYDESSKTITVEFTEAAKSKYPMMGIQFDTKFENDIINKTKINNSAKTTVNDKEFDLTGSVEAVPNGDAYAKKSGTSEGNKINWEIVMNPNGSTISQFKLTDIIADPKEQDPDNVNGSNRTDSMLIEGSFRIFEANLVGTDGFEAGAEMQPDGAAPYTITTVVKEDGQQYFVLEFTGTIHKPYILTYSTLVDATGSMNIVNKFSVEGNNQQIIQKEQEVEESVRISGSQGSGYGTRGTLKIKKFAEDFKGTAATNQQLPANKNQLAITGTDATAARFELRTMNGNLLRTGNLNEDGELIFPNLRAGWYRIVEVAPPNGYVVQSEYAGAGKAVKLDIEADKTLQYDVINPKHKATIRKVDELGNKINSSEVDAAVFTIYKKGTTDIVQDDVKAVNGEVTVELDEGEYELVEKKAAKGYLLNKDLKIAFNVTHETNGTQKIETIAFRNFQGSVKWKKESAAGVALAGAEFTVFDSNGKAVKKGTSNANGEVTISGLAPGDYTIKETKAPADYILNDREVTFTITDQNANDTAPTIVDLSGTPLQNFRGNASMKKVDAQTQAPLANAEFVIRNAAGKFYGGMDPTTEKISWIDDQNNAEKFTSDANGLVTGPDLGSGKYEFVETKAPDGYVRNRHTESFEITNSAQTKPSIVEVTKLFSNYKGSVELTKQNTAGTTLAGVTYHFKRQVDGKYYKKGTPDEWVDKADATLLTTDADGKISITGLAPGTYDFEEVQQLDGYILKEAPETITINRSATNNNSAINRTVTATNQRGKLTVTKQFENGPVLSGNMPQFALRKKGTNEYYVSGQIEPNGAAKFETSAHTDTTNFTDLANKFKINLVSGNSFSVAEIPSGEYELVEVSSHGQYMRNTTILPITIASQSQDGTFEVNENFTNYQGNVIWKKVAADGTTGLPGAEFEVVTEQGMSLTPPKTGISATDGTVTIKGLQPGKYKLKEIKAPANHIVNPTLSEPFEVPSANEGTFTADLTTGTQSSLANYQRRAQMQKTNGTEGLADAVFAIKKADKYYDQDETGQVIWKDAPTELTDKGKFISDQDGYVLSPLLGEGNYEFVEIVAPSGYVLNTHTVPFTIATGVTNQEEADVIQTTNQGEELVLQNYKGSAKITKTGLNGQLLKGVVFEFLDDKDTVLKEVTTNDSGVATVTDLGPGTYYFREKATVPGYALNANKVEIKITESYLNEVKEVSESLSNELTKVSFTKTEQAISDQGFHGGNLAGAEFVVKSDNDFIKDNTSSEAGIAWNTVASIDEAKRFISTTNGVVTIEGLIPGDYDIIEVDAPNRDRYKEIDTKEKLKVTITATGQVIYKDANGEELSSQNGIEVVNELTTVDYNGTKNWNDFDNHLATRPDEIYVTLYRQVENGKLEKVPGITNPVKVTGTTNNWTFNFDGLVKYDANGNPYTFTVKESRDSAGTKPVNGYTVTTDYTTENQLKLNNKLQLIDVSGQKSWVDDNNEFNTRPSSITLKLLRNGQQAKDATGADIVQTVDAKANWSYTFTGLPEFDKEGNKITYTVEEESVSGYKRSDDTTTMNVTNTWEQTQFAVEKIWEGDASSAALTRPENIQFQLYNRVKGNDTTFAKFGEPQSVSDAVSWKHTFTGLPKYRNVDGKLLELEYTVKEVQEDKLTGYTPSEYVDGKITNTLNTIDIPVKKVWTVPNGVDETDELDNRPNSITFHLDRYTMTGTTATEKQEDVVPPITLSNTDTPKWEGLFRDLPTHDKTGKAYKYVVREDAPVGYTASEPVVENGQTIITNTFVPSGNISVKKIWDNGNDASIQPEKITVKLYRYTTDKNQATQVGADRELSATNEWQTVFKDLAEFNNNKEKYNYYVEEVGVKGYLTNPTIDVDITDNSRVVDITNTLDSVDIPVEKKWNDLGYNMTHPASVQFILTRQVKDGTNYKEDESFKQILDVQASNNWQGTFAKVAKFDANGEPFKYIVSEEVPKGYTASNSVEMTTDKITTGTIENELTELKDVTINKTWLDSDNAFNTRPEKITFNLFKVIDGTNVPVQQEVDGQVTNLTEEQATVVQNGNTWTYTFTDLPMYENGQEIQYIAEETNVPKNYTNTNGTELTNTLQVTAIDGQKIWLDEDNKDATRPVDQTIVEVELFIKGATEAEDQPVLKNGQPVTTHLDKEGKYRFTDLPKVDADGNKLIYIVKDKVKGYHSSSNEGGSELTNTLQTPIEIKGQKIWWNAKRQPITDVTFLPEKITVELYRKVKGQKDEVKIATQVIQPNQDAEWHYKFANQPQYNEANEEYLYTVKEIVPNGYHFTGYEFAADQEVKHIINTLQTTQVVAMKEWQDKGEENSRPDAVTFNLSRSVEGGAPEAVTTKQVTAADNWQVVFTELPTHNRFGQKYRYTVDETDKPAWYSKDIAQEDNEVTVTNTLLKENEFGIEKLWNDMNDASSRPESITIQLYRGVKDENGAIQYEPDVYKTHQFVTAEMDKEKTQANWMYTFENLPEVDKDGNEYFYKAEEAQAVGYQKPVVTDIHKTGQMTTITNTLDSTEIKGTKVWEDAQNMSARPTAVTIELYRKLATDEAFPAEAFRRQIITAQDNWAYNFGKLAKVDAYNNVYEYEIREVPVAGYQTSVIDTSKVTNTLETTTISATKVWKDNDNSFGTRPNEIVFQLMNKTDLGLVAVQKVTEKDGEIVSEPITKTLTNKNADSEDANKWQVTFEDLPKVDNQGKAMEYVIQEVPKDSIKGYTTTYSEDQRTVINTLELTHVVDITKTWEDNNNSAGTRPESITLSLQRNGQPALDAVGEPIIAEIKGDVTAPNWAHVFTGLPKYDGNGDAFIYTVVEQTIKGYKRTDDGTGVTVNNQLITDQSLSVRKDWDDADYYQTTRPSEIKVQLFREFADQSLERVTKIMIPSLNADELTLNATNEWTAEFTGLPQYQNGQQTFTYVAREVASNELQGYTPTYDLEDEQYVITNTLNTTKEISVTKQWQDATDRSSRPDKVIFEVVPYIDGEEDVAFTNRKQAEVTGTMDTDTWSAKITGLPTHNHEGKEYTYGVREVDVPKGYESQVANDNRTITNTLLAKGDILVEKIWEDNQDKSTRPDSITFDLYRNVKGSKPTIFKENVKLVPTKVSDQRWSYKFEGLAEKNRSGEPYIYSVKEHAVIGYESTIDNSDKQTKVITNTLDSTSVAVEKRWDDQDYVLAHNGDVTFTLTRKTEAGTDNEFTRTLTVNAASDWKTSIDGLAKVDQDGQTFTYEIKEVENTATKGYKPGEMEQNAPYDMAITNHLTETTAVNMTKIWNDENLVFNARPESISLQLMKNKVVDGKNTHVPVEKLVDGQAVAITEKEATVTKDGNKWFYTFENLPKYENGQKIHYVVQEQQVEDYQEPVYDKDMIINTLETKAIEGTKHWDDHDNQDGKRPDEITVHLYSDVTGEEVITSQTVSAETDWHFVFEHLPVTKNGKIIEYKVVEDRVVGYEEPNYAEEGYDITNTRKPERIDISGQKTWVHEDNTEQATEITVHLLAGNKVVATTEVTAATDWKYEFNNVEKYANGEEIQYSIQEEKVVDYSIAYDGFDITNSYTPGRTNVNVKKVWNDGNDKDGIRPDEITVTLFADGKATNQTLQITVKDQWQGSFTNLPETKAGRKIDYTVQEDTVKGYEAAITGTMQNGFVITNTHKPKASKPTIPNKPETPKKPTNKKDLPKTGEVQSWILPAVGVGIIASVAVIATKRRKKKS
ncbi:Cna B-type domain-containing protein [Candidatus Enterococcus willemsii]|uniref:Gram-positive cocci surface proteins LPxTG domain-containing protein n=1 Tax=Candidatus Enterococcus willemsii TaxID=1857215 RepID=A0ABQ6Z150_9ENTE|nr:Cna B-type domain-containing protein [Enterococcus sp. CU12B]KAF1304626.1 hypothetical protein BAU17_10515 [Enterococcus sp. CU12B]